MQPAAVHIAKRDDALWLRHLREAGINIPVDSGVLLRIEGRDVAFEPMRPAPDGRPTPGLRATGPGREVWLAIPKGATIQVEFVRVVSGPPSDSVSGAGPLGRVVVRAISTPGSPARSEHEARESPMTSAISTLLVGFDSAWTATNSGALAGVLVRGDGTRQELGLPTTVDYPAAERAVLGWQAEHGPGSTIVLLDQPTIVRNETGQRPVEQIVSSVVGVRYGGMQPAFTGKENMFGSGALIWSFLARFGGPADPLASSVQTRVIETYPVLMMISLGWTLPDSRPGGRLPKYNPDRATTFSRSDWEFVCIRARDAFVAHGLVDTSRWLDRAARIEAPRKPDQDRVDAALCLLAAVHMAAGRECLMVGDQETGYIVVPHSASLRQELEQRCSKTQRIPSQWVRVFRDLAVQIGAAS